MLEERSIHWKLACEDETTVPPFIRHIREYATRLQVGHGGSIRSSHALSCLMRMSICTALSHTSLKLLEGAQVLRDTRDTLTPTTKALRLYSWLETCTEIYF